MKSNYLVDVAKYFKGEDHQIAALNWLQNNVSAPVLEEFAKIYSPSTTVPATDIPLQQVPAPVKTSTPVPATTGNKFIDDQVAKLTKYCAAGTVPNLDIGTTYFSQRDNYTMPHRTCNSTSNAMYLDWLRRAVGNPGLGKDDDYLRILLSFGDTIYHENQTSALEKYGFKTKWCTDSDNAKVDALLDAGFPVVVNILHRGTIDSPRGGHVIMLCGRRKSEGTYISQDPYGTLGSGYTDTNGKFAPISKRSFDARWQGGYRILD
jgi:hypothetical protein